MSKRGVTAGKENQMENELEQILNQYSSEQAMFNGKLWGAGEVAKAKREWQAIQTKALTSLQAILSRRERQAVREVVFESDPEVMGGELCVRGTRVPVQRIRHQLKIDDSPISLAAAYDWPTSLAEIVCEAISVIDAQLEEPL